MRRSLRALTAVTLSVGLVVGAIGLQDAQAGNEDLTPEAVEVLAELEATLTDQQRELESQLDALTQTTDPTARQTLHTTIDAIQHNIAELTTLRDALQAPLPPIAPHLTPAAQAADELQRQLDQQERKIETIHGDRLPPRP